MSRDHLSFSAYRNYKKCPAMAKAEDTNRHPRETSDAMLMSSYVDAILVGNFEQFIKENGPNIYKWPILAQIRKAYPEFAKTKLEDIKDQSPNLYLEFAIKYSDFEYAERIVEKAQNTPKIMKYFEGLQQTESRVTIDSIDYIIKPDVVGATFISDLKVMKSIQEWNWSKELGMRVPFYVESDYCLQLALYREGFPDKDEFVNVVLTKENPIDHSIINYSEQMLDISISKLKRDHKQMFDYANMDIEKVPRCEKCDWCISTKETNIIEANEWEN